MCVICCQIWVSSSHNASGYYTIYGEESLQADHFNTKLSFGDPQTLWARTGYLGFIKRTELLDASGGEDTFTPDYSIKYMGTTCRTAIIPLYSDSSLAQIATMPCLWWALLMKRWS